jgi:hypothetical protein
MMKNLFLILFLPLFFSCTKTQELSEATKNTIKKDVDQFMNNWHLAATEASYENYFSKMDSISVFIGTDASENWTKKQFEAFSKPYFDKGKAWDFKTLERNIYINHSGNFVWFDELLNTWMGTCRGSGVLEKKENIWTLKHYVLSVPIPNDDIQKVIAAKKEKDSIFLSKFKK